MKGDASLDARARALREDFVRGFVEAHATEARASATLLAIRVAGAPYALRMSDVSEIATRRRVVPVPTHERALIGLVGVRGDVLPVYSLASVLGHASTTSATDWLAIHEGKERVALAFDAFDAFLRVPLDALHERAEGVTAHIAAVVRIDGVSRTIIDVASVVSVTAPRAARDDVKES